MDSQVMIGAGLPPIPAKLVSKIEAGEFVDMAELLPDRFGNSQKPARRRKCTTIQTQAAHSHHNPRVDTVLQYLPRSHC